MHLGELVVEDHEIRGLVVDVVREVHVDCAGADVGSLAECTNVRYRFSMRTGMCAGDRRVRAKGLCTSWRGEGW